MVRVNLIGPKKLSDQHLVAEYREILVLLSYIIKHPDLENISKKYTLGKGHMKFFKDKVSYLYNRFEKIKEEMNKRGFETNRKFDFKNLSKKNRGEFHPSKEDLELIKKRLRERIRMKPNFYRYYGKYRGKDFFLGLLK